MSQAQTRLTYYRRGGGRKPADAARAEHRRQFWAHRNKASYRCPDCGRRGDHPHIDQLEVHHEDGNPFNGDPANLVGLCRHCHYQRHDRSPACDLEDWKARIHDLGDGGEVF